MAHNGVEPPEYVKQLIEDINAFQSAPAGSAESDALGARLVENMTGNLLIHRHRFRRLRRSTIAMR